MKKDVTVSQDILQYLAQRNPFSNDSSFRNIATGVLAASTVTACDGKEIGKKILEGMEGQAVSNYYFKKKDQAVTMDVKSTVKVRDEELQVLADVESLCCSLVVYCKQVVMCNTLKGTQIHSLCK